MATVAAIVAVVALVGVVTFGVLSPVFGPGGDPLPVLCSPDQLDFRVVRVTEVMGTRRIDTELENVGGDDCAVPRAMHVRIHDRPHRRVPADSEFTAQSEAREPLAPGMVRLPSGSAARGVIEWTNLCRPVDAGDLSVLAFLSEHPSRMAATWVETAYARDGLAGVPACVAPESIALVTPLTISDASEIGDWGPLAVTAVAMGGDDALTTGTIRISDECVSLETANASTLLVWWSGQASWDPGEREILFRNRDSAVIELQDGQQVGLGGSGRGLSAETLSPGEWDGLTWDEWLTSIDWTAAPGPTCRADSVWSVGEVIVDPSPSPVPPTADPSLVAVPAQDPEPSGPPGARPAAVIGASGSIVAYEGDS